MNSKVSFDPEEPSLGRIPAGFVSPPHTVTSVKRCIALVECNPALAFGDLYANTSCETPMEEGCISVLAGNCPGLMQDDPMALVQVPIPMKTTHSFGKMDSCSTDL